MTVESPTGALALDGSEADAVCNRGIALASVGQHGPALESFQKVIATNAQHLGALLGGGATLVALGRFEEAVEWLERALREAPRHPTALRDQAVPVAQPDCRGAVLVCLERVLAHDPDLMKAVSLRGSVLLDAERFEDALACFERVTERDPADVAALTHRAQALLKLRRRPESLACFERALELRPDDVRLLVNRGTVLEGLQRYQEALESFERALAREPGYFHALLNRAVVLLWLYRIEEALDAIELVLKGHPDNAAALNAKGAILWGLNRNAEARVCTERALAIQPQYVNARYNLGFIDLADGDLVSGFLHQETRWQSEQFAGQGYQGDAPLWLGKQSLLGKTILLHSEQGLGDTLQFVRYVSLVSRPGVRVLLSVQPQLWELLANLPGVSVVFRDGEPPPAHDFHCPLMSLPVAFSTSLQSIPGGVPYVHADAARVEEWRERLGHPVRPRIGIVWAGRQAAPRNIPRDMSLKRLRPLLTIDAEFISLQMDLQEGDAVLLGSLPAIKPLGEGLGHFADTAALVATLDLVITVDTAVAHLAGAMGKEVWLMNRFASCWRWRRDGSAASPWYPSMRIFRQPALGDWESVVMEVRAALEAFAAQWSAPVDSGLPAQPSAAVWMRRASLRVREGDTAGAIACYTEVLRTEPTHTEALCCLGMSLGRTGFHAEALACFDRALAITPDNADLLCLRAVALLELSEDAQALACLEQALQLDPRHFLACLHCGIALARLGQPRDALARLDEALRLDPGNARTRYHRSLVLLQLGSYREGFRELESRWQVSVKPAQAPSPRAAAWLGEPAVAGGTLLVRHEQSLADALLLARYIPQVARLWARVLLDFPPALAALLRQSFASLSNVEVVSSQAGAPGCSHECPVMSLPLALRTELATVPAQVPYLKASAPQIEMWRRRLASTGRLRVGIAWRGWASEASQSLRFDDLAPLLDLAVDFIPLHDALTHEESGKGASLGALCSCGTPIEDLADAAALIETLDLVLSPDTAMAHLAAALGKPTWVLLSRAGSWRWLEGRADSPWYPTVRVFRQGAQREWGAVLREVCDALQSDVVAAYARSSAHPEAAALSAVPSPSAGAPRARPSADSRLGAPMPASTAVLRQQSSRAAPASFDPALALPQPLNLDALIGHARSMAGQGRHREALQSFEAALEGGAQDPEVLEGCGVSLHKLGRASTALEYLDRALTLDPRRVQALIHRGLALRACGRFEEALGCLDAAVALAPDSIDAQHARGWVLQRLGRFEEALAHHDRVLAQDAGHVAAWCRRGAALEHLGRTEDARASLDRALALAPYDPDVIYNRSFLLLAQGDLVAGFRGQTLAWTATVPRPSIGSEAPIWLGHGTLAGKTVLLHHSQGLGDTIQFARYVPWVAARAAAVVLRVPDPLVRLMSTLAGGARVVGERDPLPPHDVHCPVVCLPSAAGTTLETIPASVPYLHADPEAACAWRERLGPWRRPRIGLVWNGNPQHRLRAARDIPLAELAPLLQLPVDLISLQKDLSAADREYLAASGRVTLCGEELIDFADTAALIDNLDLLISADTAAAHLAGALGTPVWILNRHAPCWRWLRGRSDSPWYPTARLFQQETAGGWATVVERVCQRAEEWCREPALAQDAGRTGAGRA